MVISRKHKSIHLGFRKKNNDEFLYKISNMNFSLSEIRDGILRGNKKSGSFKGYPPLDPKMAFVQVSFFFL